MNADIIQRFGEVAARAQGLALVEGEYRALAERLDPDDETLQVVKIQRGTAAEGFLRGANELAAWMHRDTERLFVTRKELLDLNSYRASTLTTKQAQKIIANFGEFLADALRRTQPIPRVAHH